MSQATVQPAVVTDSAPINAIVAMAHVRSVERSAEFYRLLGFEVGNYVPREASPMHWAWLYQPKSPNWKIGANLMLTRSAGSLNPDAQGSTAQEPLPNGCVLFYLYAADLVALRNQLIASGSAPGEITYPEYLPKGEFRVEDPDGYCLMIAQSFEDSP